jgi:predicted HD phosphohydrolase
MTNLSPAAQVVLDAAMQYEINPECYSREIAAALRAAADGCDPNWLALTVLHHLHAIADELEGTNPTSEEN